MPRARRTKLRWLLARRCVSIPATAMWRATLWAPCSKADASTEARTLQARLGTDAAICYALGQSLVLRGHNEEARPHFVVGAAADPQDLDCLMALLGLDASLCRWDEREATRAAILARLESG